jgi:uracil-DNA glycosylase
LRHADIFRRAHAAHDGCQADEWLNNNCTLVWSRRNGPWRPVDVLFVGAAPGNAGGKGSGGMGAHATRIPFGGDIAGANLDVLLASAGLSRDDVFLVAAMNRLPDAGGGEPTLRELAQPVGEYASSVHLLRDTILATQPRLLVVLGNVGLRSTVAAARLSTTAGPRGGPVALPSLERLKKSGLERNAARDWPEAFLPDDDFLQAWGERALPHILWLTHPSAQNMSPYARRETLFHARMVEARDALRVAVREVLGSAPPDERPDVPLAGSGGAESIYDVPEWRDAVGPRHAALAQLWRSKNV